MDGKGKTMFPKNCECESIAEEKTTNASACDDDPLSREIREEEQAAEVWQRLPLMAVAVRWNVESSWLAKQLHWTRSIHVSRLTPRRLPWLSIRGSPPRAAPLEAYDEEHRPQCVRLGSRENLDAGSE